MRANCKNIPDFYLYFVRLFIASIGAAVAAVAAVDDGECDERWNGSGGQRRCAIGQIVQRFSLRSPIPQKRVTKRIRTRGRGRRSGRRRREEKTIARRNDLMEESLHQLRIRKYFQLEKGLTNDHHTHGPPPRARAASAHSEARIACSITLASRAKASNERRQQQQRASPFHINKFIYLFLVCSRQTRARCMWSRTRTLIAHSIRIGFILGRARLQLLAWPAVGAAAVANP